MVTPILSKLGFSRAALPPVHFSISFNAVPLDEQVAYGPASIIHGQVTLNLSDRENTPAYRVRVLFTGEVTKRSLGRGTWKDKDPSDASKEILFEVESVLWGTPVPSESKDAPSTPPSSPLFVSPGRNLYLFAIRFPDVNFPPTINDPNNPIRVAYTLRAFLDRPNPSRADRSNLVEVFYLPLVPVASSPPPASPEKLDDTNKVERKRNAESKSRGKKKHAGLSVVVPISQPSFGGMVSECLRSSSGEPLLEATAELAKPAYLPGDICNVKLTLNNRSDRRITAINLALASHVTSPPLHDSPDNPTSAPLGAKPFSHSHIYFAESLSFVIPRYTKDYTENLQFKLPAEITPSSSLHATRPGGTGFELAYDLRLVLVIGGTSMWPIPRTINADQLTLVLPLTIATVPSRFSFPTQLRIPAPAPSAGAPTNAGIEIPVLTTNGEAVIDDSIVTIDDGTVAMDSTQPVFLQTLPVSPYINSSSLSSPSSPSTPWAGTPLPSPILDTAFELPAVTSSSSSSSSSLTLSQPPPPLSPSVDASGHLMVPDPAAAARLHHRSSSGSASGSRSTDEAESPVEEPIKALG